MAKIDESLLGIGSYHAEVAAQEELEKAKNEGGNRSLSIAIGDGQNLIAVSEFGSRYSSKPSRYTLFVTKPGVDDTHVCVVLAAPDVRALIGILQEIIERE